MGHHGVKIFDNRKKIDFKQTIIDFQEKTILTSLAATTVYEMHRLVPAPSYYDGWVVYCFTVHHTVGICGSIRPTKWSNLHQVYRSTTVLRQQS